MFQNFLRFRTRHQPFMVRLAYRYEMRSALTFPLASSLAEGAFTGVVAAKYFAASQLLIAVITAAPMFGNIMALVWTELSRDKRKVPFVNLLQLGVVLTIAAVALTAFIPSLVVGGWVFAGLIIIVRLLAAGIITLRSAIWRANYPRQTRGQIIGRISVVATGVLAFSTFTGSWWLDRNPRAFIYLYPAAALLGVIGIYQFSRIRVRGEGQWLRQSRVRAPLHAPRPEGLAQTDETDVLNYEPHARKAGGPLRLFRRFFSEASAILKEDKPFRDYQRWQFLSGASFMMFGPSLLYMVSREMTDSKTQYLLATIVVQIIPMLVSLVATQLWAPLFDRVNILRFRVIQCCVSFAAQALLLAGALYGQFYCNRAGITPALLIVAGAQVLVGVALAGGNLAWNLGHNDFTTAERSSQYMAVHVMLTGLRGCIAPFFGVALYKFMGRGVFVFSTSICLISLVGFWSMARRMPAGPPARVKSRAKMAEKGGAQAVAAIIS